MASGIIHLANLENIMERNTLHIVSAGRLANQLQISPRIIRMAANKLGITAAISVNDRAYFTTTDADELTEILSHQLEQIKPMGKPRAFDIATFDSKRHNVQPEADATPAKPDVRKAWREAVTARMERHNLSRPDAAMLAAKELPKLRAALVAAANQ